jgi:hypothetical protein
MKRLALYILLFLSLTAGIAAAELPALMKAEDITPYLEKMIAWHRQTVSLEVSPDLPREVLLKESLQQHAGKALASSFEFAHAMAALIEPAPKPPAEKAAEEKPAADSTAAGQPQQKSKSIFDAIAKWQNQVDDRQADLAKAKTAKTRSQANGKLRLAQEHLTILQAIAENMDTADDNGSIDHKISRLQATIPELNPQQQKPAAPVAIEQPGPPASGIIGLLTEGYSSLQDKSKIKSLLDYTLKTRDDIRNSSKAVWDNIRQIQSEGDAIGTSAAPANVTYDNLVSNMKRLTKVAVAAGGVGMSLKACGQDLSEWNDLLSQHLKDLLSHLLFRLAGLLAAVFGACGISSLISKAMPRYVPDERRLHQLHTIQKFVVYTVIALIAFLGIFTDLSSLGTFIGLMTAGLAVALQGVILSMIAYFQFFGAFGLKAGDRITISGVTGKVMKITLLRFYIMEMKESDLGYLPTGRTVGFSNAILFQPLPFFRQTPGTNFVWSEIMLTLDPSVDHETAYKKIHEAVDRVYSKHLNVMQQQQMYLQKLTQFKTEVSVPQIYLKITGSGLVVVIRYAVERDQESALHLQMTEELLSVIKKDPTLKVVNVG